TRWPRDWSSDVCSSDLQPPGGCEIGRQGSTHQQESKHVGCVLPCSVVCVGAGWLKSPGARGQCSSGVCRSGIRRLSMSENKFNIDRKSTRLNSSHVAIS